MNKKLPQLESLFWLFLFTILPNLVFAAHPEGVGRLADHLVQPVSFMGDFVYTGCLVIGGSFVFASIFKYIEHRRSPLMVPISTPIVLCLLGLALIAVPFLAMLSGSATRYSLFRN